MKTSLPLLLSLAVRNPLAVLGGSARIYQQDAAPAPGEAFASTAGLLRSYNQRAEIPYPFANRDTL
jgi:hypothetical protein